MDLSAKKSEHLKTVSDVKSANNTKTLPQVVLMVAIVDRAKTQEAERFFKKQGLSVTMSCWGEGTATLQIRELLGFGEHAKSVFMTLAPRCWVPQIITHMADAMQLRNPGRGILFVVPLSGVNGGVPQRYAKLVDNENSEVRIMYESSDKTYELIIISAERGHVDAIMDAARAAGARGGTVLQARKTADENTESFFGLRLYDELEVVAIVAERDDKLKIMKAASAVLAEKCPDDGLIFSVPVDEIVGVGGLNK